MWVCVCVGACVGVCVCGWMRVQYYGTMVKLVRVESFFLVITWLHFNPFFMQLNRTDLLTITTRLDRGGVTTPLLTITSK